MSSMRYKVETNFSFPFVNAPFNMLYCRPGEEFTIVGKDEETYACKFDVPGGSQDVITTQPGLTWNIPKDRIRDHCSSLDVAWEI